MLKFIACALLAGASIATAESNGRVFEIRTYTTHDGRLEALKKRFREHTTTIFERHGMTNVGYWVPQDPPLSQNTLIYIISHASREAAKKNWDEFMQDPEWKKVAADSEKDGKIVKKVDHVFMDAADFSPIK
jgi:NIPSNAP